MNKYDLANQLKEMYSKAPAGDQVAHIHLFGVKYADHIHRNHYKISEIVELSGISRSYATEVSKGIKLSKYVVSKS
ncbi:hypothetical protein A6P54_17885 [Bacillus sp. MKU004]|nr:hypothetical protein A6P54_17885 [Bacillus sp. MKU004]